MDDFAVEVRRRLDEFGESGDLEGRVTLDGAFGEIADPAGFEDPGFLGVEPTGASGEDTAAHVEGGGVEFDNGETAEEFFIGVEEIVVVDLVVFPKNPALRAGVGLRRPAFDDGAESVLTLVGVGEIGVIEDEEREGDGEASEKERNGEAVEGNATGLEGDNFVVLAEDAEGDENAHESAEGRELIDGIRDEVTEIIDDDHEGDVVAADVFGEFEEGEDFEQEEEGDHDDEEVVEEAAKDIEIDDGGKAGVRGGEVGTVFGTSHGGSSADTDLAATEEAAKGAEAGEEAGNRGFPAIAFHAREESEGDERENSVGGPHAGGGRDDTLASETGAGDEEQVVSGDNDDREKRAGGATGAAGLRAKRNSDEGEDKTSDGESESLVKFDTSVAPSGTMVAEEFRRGALGIADDAFPGGSHRGDFDGPVTAAKGGDGVVVRSGASEFVSGAAVEVELQLAEGGFGNYNRAFRKSNLGATRSAGFGEEDAVPVCAAGGDVVDVEDQVREALVEDAGLNGKGDLGSDESGFGGTASAEGEGGEPEGHEKGECGADEGENPDGNKNAFTADAQRGESDDLAVHGHAAQTEKNANKDGHGDGEDENAGDNAEEQSDDLRG